MNLKYYWHVNWNRRRKFIAMKATLFILLFSLVLNVNASELDLRLKDHSLFTVAFNQSYFGAAQSSFSLANIQPGYHLLEVYRINPHGRPVSVYKGHVFIPANSKVEGIVDKHHRLKTKTSPLYYSCEPNMYMPPAPVPPPAPALIGMHPHTFNSLKNSLSGIAFSSTRLETSKQAIYSNGISSAQLTELMGLLTFESDRLSLAKYAYQHTVDKEKFFMVNDSFTFSSSIDELNQFLYRN